MNPRWIGWIVAALLGAAIVVDSALLLRARLAASQTATRASLYRPGEENVSVTPPEGYFATSNQLRQVSTGTTGFWAVRYVSKLCGYCARDTTGQQLAVQLESIGVPVTLLVPRAGEELPPEEVIPKGSPQAVFVPMSWIKKFRLTFTPTFVVFGPSGRLLWTHQGTLAPDDMEAALEAVKSARRARQ